MVPVLGGEGLLSRCNVDAHRAVCRVLRRPDTQEAFPRKRGHRAFLFCEASDTAAGVLSFHPLISSQSSLSVSLLFAPTAI